MLSPRTSPDTHPSPHLTHLKRGPAKTKNQSFLLIPNSLRYICVDKKKSHVRKTETQANPLRDDELHRCPRKQLLLRGQNRIYPYDRGCQQILLLHTSLTFWQEPDHLHAMPLLRCTRQVELREVVQRTLHRATSHCGTEFLSSHLP